MHCLTTKQWGSPKSEEQPDIPLRGKSHYLWGTEANKCRQRNKERKTQKIIGLWFSDRLFSMILQGYSSLKISRSTYFCSRSLWPRRLRGSSAANGLLGLWVRIPPGAWKFVCCECCVLSGRGLCGELTIHPEESYRLWCVVVCDLETSWMRRLWPTGGLLRQETNKQTHFYKQTSITVSHQFRVHSLFSLTVSNKEVLIKSNKARYCICTVHVIRSLNCQYQHMHNFNVID